MVKIYFKNISNLLKIWFYFIFVSWIYYWIKSSEAHVTSYIRKTQDLVYHTETNIPKCRLLGFRVFVSLVLQICVPFLYRLMQAQDIGYCNLLPNLQVRSQSSLHSKTFRYGVQKLLVYSHEYSFLEECLHTCFIYPNLWIKVGQNPCWDYKEEEVRWYISDLG